MKSTILQHTATVKLTICLICSKKDRTIHNKNCTVMSKSLLFLRFWNYGSEPPKCLLFITTELTIQAYRQSCHKKAKCSIIGCTHHRSQMTQQRQRIEAPNISWLPRKQSAERNSWWEESGTIKCLNQLMEMEIAALRAADTLVVVAPCDVIVVPGAHF